jgi:hypothetical protein
VNERHRRAPLPASALGSLLGLLASCLSSAPSVPVVPLAAPPTPPAFSTPTPKLPGASFSEPWLGMYVASKQGEDFSWWFLAPRPGGAWLLTTFAEDRGKRIAKVTLEPRGEGWSVRPGASGDATASLRRPAHDGEPWNLSFAEGSVPQRPDPESTRLAARLSRGLRLVRLDERHRPGAARVEDAYTKDAIEVLDGMFTRLEIERHEEVDCYLDVLLPLLIHERGTRPSPPREEGLLSDMHSVKYMLLKTGRHCPDAFERDGDYEGPELGQDAGVTFFLREAEPLGAVIVSYMYAGLFVAPGIGWSDVTAMSKVARAALSEQAE